MKKTLYIMALLAGMVLFTACEGSTWEYEVTVSYRYTDNPDKTYDVVWVETMSPNSNVKTAKMDAYTNMSDNGQRLVIVVVWKFNDSPHHRYAFEREVVYCPGIKVEHVSTSVKLLSKTD